MREMSLKEKRARLQLLEHKLNYLQEKDAIPNPNERFALQLNPDDEWTYGEFALAYVLLLKEKRRNSA